MCSRERFASLARRIPSQQSLLPPAAHSVPTHPLGTRAHFTATQMTRLQTTARAEISWNLSNVRRMKVFLRENALRFCRLEIRVGKQTRAP